MGLKKYNVVLFIFILIPISIASNSEVKRATKEDHFCISQAESKTDPFDFRALNKNDEDYTVYHDDKEYRLQLCRELVKPCNGKKGYNICMKVNNTEIGFGKIPPKYVRHEPGRLHFVFIGDPYNSTVSYTANIKLSCDFSSLAGTFSPEIFPLGTAGKDLFIVWKTVYACTEEFQTNCTAIDKYGRHYDLEPLKRYSDNYRIQIQGSEDLVLILNVCHSIIYGYNSVCNRQSGACWQDGTSNPQKPEFENLGIIIPNETVPSFDANGTLKLVYKNGDICRQPNIDHIKTTITFICDFGETDSEPEYVGRREKCDYQLLWRTAKACSLEDLKNHSRMSSNQCTVIDPITSAMYDLRLLQYRDLSVMSFNKTKFEMKICAPLTNNICGTDSGVCNIDAKKSYGKSNTKLLWEQGGPYLNYTDGDVCSTGEKRYTKIGFFCGPEGMQVNFPTVMEVEECYSIVYWSVNFVCNDKKIKCFTEDHNLNPLIQSVDNYVVKNNDTEFHINVCRPLVAKSDLTCAHGTAVCKATRNHDGKLINEVNLGYVVQNLYTDGSNTVLLYQNGSVCPENTKVNLNSKIIFSCDYNTSKGKPEFESYKDCTYSFKWKTRYVCPYSRGKFISNSCTIRTDALHEIDLSSVKNKTYNARNEKGDDYTVCLCGCESSCHGSVCKGDLSYGNITDVVIKYDEDVVILRFISDKICNMTEKYVAEVRMICNESAGVSAPSFVWDKKCFVEFKWETSITCISKMSLIQNTSDDHKNDEKPSVFNLIFAVILLAIVILVTIIYCCNYSQARQCVKFCSRSSSTRKVNDSVKYSRVNTTEEARLLLDGSSDNAATCQTDSSDDELLDI